MSLKDSEYAESIIEDIEHIIDTNPVTWEMVLDLFVSAVPILNWTWDTKPIRKLIASRGEVYIKDYEKQVQKLEDEIVTRRSKDE